MNPTPEQRAALDELVARFAIEHHCPSIAWGVVADGGLAVEGSTGALSDGTAPTSETVYRIASMTKSFTSATVLALRDRGVFSLNGPIGTLAPELATVVGPTADAAPITLAHLLSMSSGLATDDAWADRHLDITTAEFDALLSAGTLFAASPGTAFEYSNLGFGMIGRIVRRTTGSKVQDLVTSQMLRPLGMSATTWVQPDHDHWARPYREVDGTICHDGLAPLGDGGIAPMGGLWTTVADLVRWVTFLDDAFPARDEPDDGPLRRSSRREMQQMHTYAGMSSSAGRKGANGYGYGLLVRDDPALGRVVGHSGGLPGYGSNMRWLPGRRVGAIALANVTYAPMSDLTMRMLDLLDQQGLVPAEQVPVPEMMLDLATRLVSLLDDWGDDAADALFADNVAPDDPYDRRRMAARRLATDCGGRLTMLEVTAESATSGSVTVDKPAGQPVRISFEIAPTRPPRIQLYEIH